MNLGSVLKMFGVTVPPEVIAKVEEIFPYLPGILKHAVGRFNGYHDQLEQQRQEMILLTAQVRMLRELILEERHERGSNDGHTLTAGIGATERAFADSGTG